MKCHDMLRTMTDLYDIDSDFVLSASNLELVNELRTTREFIKKLKAREDDLRKLLLAELKDASTGVTAAGVPVLEIQRQPRTNLDKDRLQALYPDAWEDCQTESVVTVVRLPEAFDPGDLDD